MRSNFGLLVGVGFLFHFSILARSDSATPLDTTRTPQVGAPGISETTGQIAAREDGEEDVLDKGNHRHVPPRHSFSNAGTLPGGNGGRQGSGTPPALSPLAAQTVNSNFTAAGFADCSGWPPDTMGAVGPRQFIVALNGRVRSFSKATGLADGGINVGTDAFFASVMTSGLNFTTDPRIRYDRLSGRWFITMIDVPGQLGKQPNRVMIAMSDTAIISPSTVWTFFQFSGDPSDFADYPTLGIDANALYMGANIFSTSSGSFVNTTVYVVRKSSLLAGGPIVVTTFTGLISGHGFSKSGPYTPQGVDNFDTAATEGYFIGVDYSSLNTLQLLRVSNPGGTPSLSGNVSIGVATFSQPISVTVQGTSGTIDGLDRRLLAAHYRNGSLWTSQNIGVNSGGGTSSPDRNGVRWYQIGGIPSGQTPSVTQSGTVFQNGATSLSYWMGTVMVSGQGHAAMGFTAGGPSHFLDAAATGRLLGDSAGAMDTPVTYTASSSAYNPSDGSNPHRWGDYSYTSLDPADDMTMWTVQEWCQSPGDGFAVQVAQLLAPPPALPTNCNPATLTQGVANASVVIKGSTANGAGFFEPGTSFSNHLGLRINGGGVTVNSLSYNNPSNITALLTIAANAAAGSRTITVTNPDGQTATSSTGLLTILAAGGSNNPPTLAAIPNRTITTGTTLTVTNSASDPDVPPQVLTFSLGTGAATNATINSGTGVFSWTPTVSQIGSNGFSVIVTDNGVPPLSATQSFSVTVIATNHTPTLAAIPNRTILAGSTLTFTNVAMDTDSPPQTLTFSLDAGAATGANVNPVSGIFSWVPAQTQAGTNNFSVIVTDNGAPPLSATQSFAVVVTATNTPPFLAAIANRTLSAGSTLTFTNAATDTDTPPQTLTFSLGAGAAAGAGINPVSGIFSWTPVQTQAGTNGFSVIVTDNGAPPLSATQNLAVVVMPTNTPPILTAIPDQTLHATATLLWTNSATDTDTPPQTLTFTLDPGAPGGATIGAASGILSWTPTEAQIGTNSLTVRVTDSGTPSLSDTKSFGVNVVSRPLLAIPALSNGTVYLSWSAITGTSYRVQFTPDIAGTGWLSLSPDVLSPGPVATATDTNLSAIRFYRVQVLP